MKSDVAALIAEAEKLEADIQSGREEDGQAA